MSRFGNLEFEGSGDRGASRQEHHFEREQRGEAHYLAEAQSAFENGNFESALRLYSKVLEFNPQNAAAWTGQVRMLIELGECGEAKLWADKALEKFPNEPELLAAKAVALARSGDLQGALAFSDSAIAERGDTVYVWLSRADVLLARRESRADFCFERAFAQSPGDWFVRWLAGRIRMYHKQFALGLKLMQQAVEANAGHFLAWLELGNCQRAIGLTGPARHSYEQARQLNPGCVEVTVALTKLSQTGIGSRLRGWLWKLFNT